MNVSILIFEDEPMAASNIRQNLHKYGYENVTVCGNLATALGHLAEHRFELALLDIHSEEDKHAGLKIAKLLRSQGEIQLIFMTAHRNFKGEAMDINPRSILFKPFNPGNLINAVEMAIKEIESQRNSRTREESMVRDKDKLFIRNRTTYFGIPFADVLYVAADSGTINIVSHEKKMSISSSLKNFQDQVDYPYFVRIDKGYIINIQQIQSFSHEEVVLNGGMKFPLSKTAFTTIKSRSNILKSK